MNKAVKIILAVFAALVGVFGALVTIYWFNLDMKLIAYVVDLILQKHYDKMPHNQYV